MSLRSEFSGNVIILGIIFAGFLKTANILHGTDEVVLMTHDGETRVADWKLWEDTGRNQLGQPREDLRRCSCRILRIEDTPRTSGFRLFPRFQIKTLFEPFFRK